MRDPTKKPGEVYAEFVAVPDTLLAQIVNGELVTSPRAAIPHALTTSTLHTDLAGPYQRGRGGPGGWWILFEPELHFRDDILVPDLAGWRVERMPAPPQAAFIELAPDWVCEVLSPSTAGLDRVRKNPIYAREGVRWMWFVDPIGKTLEAYELREGAWVQLGAWANDDKARVIPFDAVELELSALWIPDTTK